MVLEFMISWVSLSIVILILFLIVSGTKIMREVVPTIVRHINSKSLNGIKYDVMYKEFHLFAYRIIVQSILTRFVKSKQNTDGTLVAMKEISDMSEPFYQGLVVNVIGTMGDELVNRFFMFYRRTIDNEHLVSAVSSIIEAYSMELISRVRILTDEASKISKEAIKNNQSPMNETTYVFDRLIISIARDLQDIER